MQAPSSPLQPSSSPHRMRESRRWRWPKSLSPSPVAREFATRPFRQHLPTRRHRARSHSAAVAQSLMEYICGLSPPRGAEPPRNRGAHDRSTSLLNASRPSQWIRWDATAFRPAHPRRINSWDAGQMPASSRSRAWEPRPTPAPSHQACLGTPSHRSRHRPPLPHRPRQCPCVQAVLLMAGWHATWTTGHRAGGAAARRRRA